jgi:hypothetical protein
MTSRKRNHVATTTAAAVTTEKNDYLGCFLYASNNDVFNAVQLSYSQSSLDDTFNQPTSSSSSLGAAVGEEVAKKKKKYYHRISPTATSLSENDVGQEQNANVVVDEVSTTATVVATTNSKSIVFFSAQNEIFSIGMKLYVGIRAEKLKCKKDFLHV